MQNSWLQYLNICLTMKAVLKRDSPDIMIYKVVNELFLANISAQK